MFDKLRQAHLHAHDWQQGSLTFVPLRGTWFAQSEHSFDLEEEINKFLSSDKKVLLLLGDSGSGKSLYTQGLASTLWSEHKAGSPIPVWISLPSLKNPINRAVEETFEKFGFSTDQITSLKQTHSFVFIFDAFDEIHQLKNLWVSNHLDQWKAKIIITCRREYLYHVDNYKHFFTPFSGEKALYLEYDEMIIKPFSEEQIEQYIKRYIQHQKPEWSLEQYQKVIEEMPGLKNLIKTPFLLKLAMDALPKMPKDKEQKHMTQAKLYDVFIEQWFIRQEQKLKLAKKIREDEDIKPEFWDHAKRLAQLMHQQKVTQVTYDSSQSSDLFFDAEENPWQKFFNPENLRIELLRTACLVREVGQHQYAFIHNSLLEYFLTRDLYENLLPKQQEVKVIQEAAKSPQLEVKKPQDYFNERLLVEEANTLQFLSDRVDEDEGFKKTLFVRVYASRRNSQAGIGASNALSVLNRARISFSGMDLSDIDAPQADLNGGIFSHTCLKEANLQEAILTGAYLGHADFTGANLSKANFGEYPTLDGSNKVFCICYSNDNNYMAVGLGEDVILYIKKHKEYEKLTELKGHTDDVKSIAFSPDGKRLASGSSDKTVRVWDMYSHLPLAELKGHSDNVQSVAFSPDGKTLASGSSDDTVQLWEVITGQPLAELKGHMGTVTSVVFSPDGKTLASGSDDHALRLWDLFTYESLAELEGFGGNITSVAFSPDGKMLASGNINDTVQLWEVISAQLLAELKGHAGPVNSVAFSPDGKMLASGSDDRSVRLWDIWSRRCLTVLKGHTNSITSVAFSPNGKMFASAGDVTVRLWQIPSQQFHTELNGYIDSVSSITLSPDGKHLAFGNTDGTVRLWDRLTQQPLAILKGHRDMVTSVAYSPDGKMLASGSKDSTVCLWDAITQQLLAKWEGHASTIKSVVFSPNGKMLATGSYDKTVQLWNTSAQPLNNARLVATLKGHTGWVHSVVFSPDGKLLASGSSDKTVRLWDTFTQQPLAELKGHKDAVHSVAFSPDGKELASAGPRDNEVLIWDAVAKRLRFGRELKGHTETVNRVAYSPDGKTLASGSDDNTVRLWNASTQQPLTELRGHTGPITDIAFSQDGKLLASRSWDKSIILWGKIREASLQQEKWIMMCRITNFSSLLVEKACFDGAKISSQNFQLLKQRGASNEQAQIIDVSDEQEQIVQPTATKLELKDKPISTSGTTSSFWSPSREYVSQLPTPTKDTGSQFFTLF